MLAMVCVVQIGSMTRTSACSTARRTFSWAVADSGSTDSGSARASRPAISRSIVLSPEARTEVTVSIHEGVGDPLGSVHVPDPQAHGDDGGHAAAKLGAEDFERELGKERENQDHV